MRELLELAEARRQAAHETLALATVFRVDGSSYRRIGARMLVGGRGRIAGSVSGGCLEESVVLEAQKTLVDRRGRLLTFDTTRSDDLVFGSGLGCQGKIWVTIELLPAHEAWPLAELVHRVRLQRTPVVWITRLFDEPEGVRFQTLSCTDAGDALPPPSLGAPVAEVFSTGKNRVVDDASSPALIEWIAPPVALLIFGGGPDVMPLVTLAAALGHEVTVVDRRPDVARSENFPGALRVLCARSPQVLLLVPADGRTAAVLMNHHYETDRDVLGILLSLALPYVGLLGPRRRTERILFELAERGLAISPDTAAALHGPAGLDIGAADPTQIALSILAEIQATLADRSGGKLKFRAAPIHLDREDSETALCALPA
ncbi:MAG: alanine dehydrogenase [Verrucomicrobia bacterium]|nr:alanine dehydrogenase [Verrucomicrobiota bacterium]